MLQFTTETVCPTLDRLQRAEAIRAIHAAHLQLAAINANCDCRPYDNAPALAALAQCMKAAGHPGYDHVQRAPQNIGGSLLPSSGPTTYREKMGKFGTFQTRPMPDLDTHALFYAPNRGDYAGQYSLIAMHPNGYTCDELALRMIAAWDSGDTSRALAQAEYVTACGGLSKGMRAFEVLAAGDW